MIVYEMRDFTDQTQQQDTMTSMDTCNTPSGTKTDGCHIISDDYPIVVNYTADQEGQDIRPNDVVRPINRRYTIKCDNEVKAWQYLSRGRMPTYGNCQRCYKSGPLGKYCNECSTTHKGPGYVIMTYGEKILDAITISEILQKNQETAKADRIYKSGMDRMKRFDTDQMVDAATQRFKATSSLPDKRLAASRIYDAAKKLRAMVE